LKRKIIFDGGKTISRLVNSIVSTAFLIAYFIFKKSSVPFNLSKAKRAANKNIRANVDPSAYGKRLKVLFVTGLLPSKMHGGGVAMLNLIKELSKYNDISLISFISFENEREYIKEIKPYVKKIRIFERWAKTKVLEKGVGFIPDYIRDEFYCPELAEEISSELKRDKYDILQFEYLQMAIYIDLCKIPKRTKVLITDLEIVNMAFRQRIKLFPLWLCREYCKEYLRIFWFETSFLKRFSRVFVFTKTDARSLLKYSPDISIAVHPVGVDFAYFSKELAGEEFPSLVFLGNYQHPPNRDAMVYFSRDIFPKIKKKYPGIKLYIVGHMPRKEILKLAENDKNIIVTNTVEDVRPYIQRASVFVAPIISGGGQRIKVLEAMASKKAIVSTPLGCSGIEAEDGKQVLIAKNDREFVEDIILLLENAQLRKDLGRNASELAKSYDWDNIARQRQNVYLQLLK
jgi:glycosyltransferase involved in cell wall biosynthesis